MWILYKNTFFSPTSEAHFVSRPSRFKLCATVNVILAAAVAFSSSMFCTYWAFSVCLDPSSVETQQFHLFFHLLVCPASTASNIPAFICRKTYWCLLLWVRAAPGRCVAELEGKKKSNTQGYFWFAVCLCSGNFVSKVVCCCWLRCDPDTWSGTLQPVSASWLSE